MILATHPITKPGGLGAGCAERETARMAEVCGADILPADRVGAADALGSQLPASPNGCDPLLSAGPAAYASALAIFDSAPRGVGGASATGLVSRSLPPGRIMTLPGGQSGCEEEAGLPLRELMVLAHPEWGLAEPPATSLALDWALYVGAAVFTVILITCLFP